MGDSSFWRYPFFTPALGAAAREPAARIETPLRLEHRHRWDPGEEYAEAGAVFEALLWLNPGDNQGARELVDTVRAHSTWEPTPRLPGEEWADRGNGRRALLDRASLVLEVAPCTPPGSEIESALEPLLWLLDRGRDGGLQLTQTGALARAIVREAAERFPHWWDAELFGPPHQEAELVLLETLDALAREAGLLRKRKRRLLATARAKAILEEPATLIDAVAPHIYTGSPFEREIAELASAVLLVERKLARDALVEALHDAVHEDWRTEGGPLEERGVERALAPFRHTMLALGALSDPPDRERLSLPDAGAALLAQALRRSARPVRSNSTKSSEKRAGISTR